MVVSDDDDDDDDDELLMISLSITVNQIMTTATEMLLITMQMHEWMP